MKGSVSNETWGHWTSLFSTLEKLTIWRNGSVHCIALIHLIYKYEVVLVGQWSKKYDISASELETKLGFVDFTGVRWK